MCDKCFKWRRVQQVRCPSMHSHGAAVCTRLQQAVQTRENSSHCRRSATRCGTAPRWGRARRARAAKTYGATPLPQRRRRAAHPRTYPGRYPARPRPPRAPSRPLQEPSASTRGDPLRESGAPTAASHCQPRSRSAASLPPARPSRCERSRLMLHSCGPQSHTAARPPFCAHCTHGHTQTAHTVQVRLTRKPREVSSCHPEFVPGRDTLVSPAQTAAGFCITDADSGEHVLATCGVPVRLLLRPNCRSHPSCERGPTPQTQTETHSRRAQAGVVADMQPFVLLCLRSFAEGRLDPGLDGRYSAGPLDLAAFLAAPPIADAVDAAVAKRQRRNEAAGRPPGAKSTHLQFVVHVRSCFGHAASPLPTPRTRSSGLGCVGLFHSGDAHTRSPPRSGTGLNCALCRCIPTGGARTLGRRATAPRMGRPS